MVTYSSDIKAAAQAMQKFKLSMELVSESLAAARAELARLNTTLENTEKARAVVQKVASRIQKNLEFRLTNIVTMALAAVFDDPYEFRVRFVERRNQTECDMFFVKNGNECDPLESSGGGAVDIASMALRMAVWSIRKTRAIQILDEPAKFLSRDMQEACSKVLKELSEKLGIQLIIISHIPEMIAAADRVLKVDQKHGRATVTIID